MKRRTPPPAWNLELLVVLSPLFIGLLIGAILACTGSAR